MSTVQFLRTVRVGSLMRYMSVVAEASAGYFRKPRHASRVAEASVACFFSIEDVSFGPFNFDDISPVWTVLLANSAHHLSGFPCLFFRGS